MFDDKQFSKVDGVSMNSSSASVASRPRPSADPRRRIFDAIVHTVARRGYDRATLMRVLADAQLPEAVFTEHFRDKRDCFMQAIDELISDAERVAIEEFARAAPWQERVRRALSRLLDGLARNQDAARVVFVEMLAAGPAAHQRQRACLQLFTSLIEEGRSEARHANALPPQMSEAIVGGIASIVHRRVLQGEVAELPSLLGDLTYFALLPYLDEQRTLSGAQPGSGA